MNDSSAAAYRLRQEAFVTGHEGTSLAEVALLSSVGAASVLLRNVAAPWLFPGRQFSRRPGWRAVKLLLDYAALQLPTVLAFTVWADRAAVLVLAQLTVAMSLLLFSVGEYVYLYRDERPTFTQALDSPVNNDRPWFIIFGRAYIFIAVAVGILACDFEIFPRRLAKTETYGYGLMDVGVGFFVAVNGAFAAELKPPALRPTLLRRLLTNSALLLLGAARLISVKMSGYQEHVSEYGLHLNFFFILAFVKILGSLVFSKLPASRCAGVCGAFLLAAHECALGGGGLRALALHGSTGDDGRASLFDANREGLCALAGYFALYCFGVQIGSLIRVRRGRLRYWLLFVVQLAVLGLLSLAALFVCEVLVGHPSRRLANAPFVFFVICIVFLHMTLFAAIEVLALFGAVYKIPLFANGDTPFEQLQPCLLTKISRRGLFYFLAANALTGFVNFSINTLDAEPSLSVGILCAYTFALSFLACFF